MTQRRYVASLTTWTEASGGGRRAKTSALAPRAAIMAAAPTIPRGGDGGDDGIDLFGLIRKNLGRLILSLLAAWTLGAAYLVLAQPTYTATAQLFVDPRTRKVVSEDVVQSGGGIDIALFESQVSIIGSDSVLRRVIDAERLTDDAEFAPPYRSGLTERLRAMLGPQPRAPDAMTVALTNLSRAIKVRRAQNTYVINVDVTSPNPVKAARIANALTKAYLDDQADAKSDGARRANALIDARLDELKGQVRRAETNVDEFRRGNRIVTSEGGMLNEQQLTKLNSELVGTRTLVAATKAKLDELTSTLRRGVSPETLPEAMNSGVIQKLRDQYTTVARREAALSAQFQPRHPAMADVRSQVVAIKAQIAAELQRISTATQSEYQIATNREREIERTLARSEDEVSKTTTSQIRLRELEREAEAGREVLRAFLARAKETQEQQNTSIADARVIGIAAVPAKPTSPNALIVLALASFAGLGLGLGRALLRDMASRSRDRESATNVAADWHRAAAVVADRIPANGEAAVTFAAPENSGIARRPYARLPLLANAAGRGRALRRLKGIGGTGPTPAFGDFIATMSDGRREADTPYRQAVLGLYDKLRARARPAGAQIVLLVAHEAGAGTSSTALSLAYAATAAGERTLLVDAASANASLSIVFAGDIQQDNPCVLDDKEDLIAISARDSRSGLTLLPIALADLRQLRVSQRQRFAIGLKTLAADFDVVVIDGGQPLEDEAIATLAPLAESILIVARTEADAGARAADILAALEVPADRIAGTVITQSGAASLQGRLG